VKVAKLRVRVRDAVGSDVAFERGGERDAQLDRGPAVEEGLLEARRVTPHVDPVRGQRHVLEVVEVEDEPVARQRAVVVRHLGAAHHAAAGRARHVYEYYAWKRVKKVYLSEVGSNAGNQRRDRGVIYYRRDHRPPVDNSQGRDGFRLVIVERDRLPH